MNGFDAGILQSLNRAAGQWPAFDVAVVWAADAPFVKGCVFGAVMWALWCGSSEALKPARRAIIIATIVGALAAEFLARVAALVLPFRPRPLHNPAFEFVVPGGLPRTELGGWSAFPSDHAVMFAAVAVGILFASRRAGVFLFVWAVVVICLPRIYLGLHHPTDILGGLALGAAIGVLAQQPAWRDAMARPFLAWEQRHALSFYAVAWYFLYELARMFEDFRFLLSLVARFRH